MICPRCRGLVVLDRSIDFDGFPVYCINCGWCGNGRQPRELETVAVYIEPMPNPRRSGPIPMSPAERARRLDRHFPLDFKELLRRANISAAMKRWHASQGHHVSTDATPNQAASTDTAIQPVTVQPPQGSA